MPAPKTSPGDELTVKAALEALAAVLDPRDFAITYTGGDDQSPQRLTVSSRYAQLAEVIYADAQSYWWSWGERMAAVGNPKAAAEKISRVLHVTPEPLGTDESPAQPAPADQPGESAAPGRPRNPGYDEITVTPPPGRCLCSSAEHRRLGVLAEVVITFGELGIAWQQDNLWQMNWGKSFALCTGCWDSIRRVAEERRPGLTITELPLPRRRPGISQDPPSTGTTPPPVTP
jgi:hypothetical protein